MTGRTGTRAPAGMPSSSSLHAPAAITTSCAETADPSASTTRSARPPLALDRAHLGVLAQLAARGAAPRRRAPRSARADRSRDPRGRRAPAAASAPAPARAGAPRSAAGAGPRARSAAAARARARAPAPRRRRGRPAASRTACSRRSRCRRRRELAARTPGTRARCATPARAAAPPPRSASATGASIPAATCDVPAPGVATFEHGHAQTALGRPPRDREADRAGADHDDVHCLGIVLRRPQRKSPYRHYPARS